MRAQLDQLHLQRPTAPCAGKGVEEMERCHVAVGVRSGTGILKTICRFSSFKLEVHVSYDPAAVLEKW